MAHFSHPRELEPAMLAKAVPTIPPGASYEPKWDGFRSICFRDRDEVELHGYASRSSTGGCDTVWNGVGGRPLSIAAGSWGDSRTPPLTRAAISAIPVGNITRYTRI